MQASSFDNDLISSELKKDSQAGIDSVKNNIITGAEFINSYSDGKFLSTDLSDIGRKFTNDYYEDNSDFSKNNGSYLDDYIKIFEKIIDKKSVYHVEDSEQNYLLIKIYAKVLLSNIKSKRLVNELAFLKET